MSGERFPLSRLSGNRSFPTPSFRVSQQGVWAALGDPGVEAGDPGGGSRKIAAAAVLEAESGVELAATTREASGAAMASAVEGVDDDQGRWRRRPGAGSARNLAAAGCDGGGRGQDGEGGATDGVEEGRRRFGGGGITGDGGGGGTWGWRFVEGVGRRIRGVEVSGDGGWAIRRGMVVELEMGMMEVEAELRRC